MIPVTSMHYLPYIVVLGSSLSTLVFRLLVVQWDYGPTACGGFALPRPYKPIPSGVVVALCTSVVGGNTYSDR